MQDEQSQPTPLSFGDRAMVAIWRRGVIPLFGVIRGMSPPPGRVVERRYGDLPDETMDVIEPLSASTKRLPVVFFHGGGWLGGSKGAFYTRPMLALADAGHRVFSLNYPLAPEYPHPQAILSILRALAKLYREENIRALHLVGDSAGGNLAAMVALIVANPELHRKFVTESADVLPTVCSAVSLYGVLDRTSWIKDGFPSARLFIQAYAGASALDPAYSPVLPITPMDVPNIEIVPPMFIGVGSKDLLARSSPIYAEHLASRGAKVTYKVYEGADHAIYCFEGAQSDELRRDVGAFLAANEG